MFRLLKVSYYAKRGAKPYCCRWKDETGTHGKWFATQKQAEAYGEHLQNERAEFGAFRVTDDERALLYRLRQVAEEQGSATTDLLKPLLKKETQRSLEQKSVADALASFELDCQRRRLSPETVADYRKGLLPLQKPLSKRVLTALDAPEIRAAIFATTKAESSRQHHLRIITVFLNWCAKPSDGLKPWDTRPWLPHGLAKQASWAVAKRDDAGIGFLQVDEARTLLNACTHPQITCLLALALFAGLRPYELFREDRDRRLSWEHLDFQKRTLTVPAKVAKRRKTKILRNVAPNLWAWLKQHREEKGAIITLTNKNVRRNLDKLQTETGVNIPRDGLRHTFASHAYWRGLEWAMEIMRHEGDSGVFLRHYKGNVRKADATAFFKLKP